jgi:hypothetical protein
MLVGITSQRCPECGTPIDPTHPERGRRRSKVLRVAAGLILLTIAPVISWRPVTVWAGSIYWYQYRPTYLVMRDLERGSGIPPPIPNPLQRMPRLGYPRSSHTRIDLARVALSELLERDEQGKLSPEYRRKIDEFALANLDKPFTVPVQYYLNLNLFDRVLSGKLTRQDKSTFYERALSMSVSADPVVRLGDEVPIHFHFQAFLFPDPGWIIVVTLKSAQVDGKDPRWPQDKNEPQWPIGEVGEEQSGCGLTRDRYIQSSALGSHRVHIVTQIDFHYDNENPSDAPGNKVFSEIREFDASFTAIKQPGR